LPDCPEKEKELKRADEMALPAEGAATTFAAKIFQRIWPRVMLGVMFVLEVVWILFLTYLVIALLIR
jgi:hypothetical protein